MSWPATGTLILKKKSYASLDGVCFLLPLNHLSYASDQLGHGQYPWSVTWTGLCRNCIVVRSTGIQDGIIWNHKGASLLEDELEELSLWPSVEELELTGTECSVVFDVRATSGFLERCGTSGLLLWAPGSSAPSYEHSRILSCVCSEIILQTDRCFCCLVIFVVLRLGLLFRLLGFDTRCDFRRDWSLQLSPLYPTCLLIPPGSLRLYSHSHRVNWNFMSTWNENRLDRSEDPPLRLSRLNKSLQAYW